MAETPVNVRVAVRVRPLLPSERLHSHQVCVKKVPKNKNQLIVGKDRSFTFDHLHWWNTKQLELYKATIRPLVDTCFQGYNATVFAYGQTGSGKTYTIGGANPANVTKEERGIIPRAVEDIFNEMKQPGRKHIDHAIHVSYVEIYMEEVRDLLEVDIQKCQNVHIREDHNGNTVIVGAKEEVCVTADEVLSLLQKGSTVRHTGATQMNELSSRSHAIFTLRVIQTWPSTPRPKLLGDDEDCPCSMTESVGDAANGEEKLVNVMSSKFHFVDLAGSERANRTGNTGERFKESVQINTGLLALGNVISALSDPKKKKVGHIPYRDSKITRVLKDSLGGNAHTVMITCISPSSSSFAETINALQYANRTKKITNKPVINRDPQQILIEEMQDEIEELKQQLQSRPTTREVAMDKQRVLEQEVQGLQHDCGSYKELIEEATRYVKIVCSGKAISKAHVSKMKKWLKSVAENDLASSKLSNICDESVVLSRDQQIEKELNECKRILESDDKVFAEKESQIKQLGAALVDAQDDARQKEESLEIVKLEKKQQSEKLVEQKVIIEQLQEEIQYLKEEFSQQLANDGQPSHPSQGIISGRAQSVPHPSRGVWHSSDSQHLKNDAKRAHSSPPLITAERVMTGFRARNHVLAERIEEEDEVDHKFFPTDEDENQDGEGDGHQEGLSDRSSDSRRHDMFKNQFQQWRIPSARKNNESNLEQDAAGNTDSELNVLRESTLLSVRRLKESELRAQNSNNKIRELSINIRMKEELIRDLVRTGNDAEAVNRDYLSKIMELQREVQTAKRDLLDAHKLLQSQHNSGGNSQEMQKLKEEYEQKLRVAKSKVQMLQKKQKETENIASIPTQNKKKIDELQLGIAAMRQMQEDMQKKLKSEQERKRKLESVLSKDRAKIKELELQNKNREKVLKRKTEEVAVIQKKLRNAQSATGRKPDDLDEQKRWLDEEIGKAVEQQNLLKQLEDALRAREAAVVRREEALQQKEKLEIKKMRSSQVITSEVLQLSSQLSSVDQKLHARTQQLKDSSNSDRIHQGSNNQKQLKVAIERLLGEKNQLENKKKALEEKLSTGTVLGAQDERELIELNEAVDALTAAIEWHDDTIVRASTSADLRESRLKLARERNSVLQKHIKNLSSVEAGILLSRCFERILELREQEQSLESKLSDVESKMNEGQQAAMEAESALNRFVVESDRKLMEMEKKYEHRTQQLVKQLAEQESAGNESKTMQEKTELIKRVEMLEKDLQHYKSSNRELKKKLRDIANGNTPDEIPLVGRSVSESDLKLRGFRKETTHSTDKSVTEAAPIPLSRPKLSSIPSDGDNEHQPAFSSPRKSQRRSVQSLQFGDSLNLESESSQFPIQISKIESSPNVPGFLRRSKQEVTSNYTGIPNNSVEYLEFQNLQNGTRVSSSGRRITPGQELTNQSGNNLISVPLSENFNSENSKVKPGALLPGFNMDGSSDQNGSKSTKMDAVITPVRISKKDIKRISKNELSQRKNSLSSIHDSRSVTSLTSTGPLESHKNL